MIESIKLIRNIGRFDSCASNHKLNRLTVVFAENARGKTTITSILRSLSTNNPVFIEERKRLGTTAMPHVVVEVNGQQKLYQNNLWTASFPDIYIFDDYFVNENIYSGLSVETDQRYNLHDLIIGRQGVILARQVEELTQKLSGIQSGITEKEKAIRASVSGNFNIDEFFHLPQIDDIDSKILEAERRLAALQNSVKITTTSLFEPFSFHEIDIKAIQDSIALTLDDLQTDTLTKVTKHFNSLKPQGENWIATGVKYLEASQSPDFCPFCNQNLNQSEIVSEFRKYFSKKYANHLANIRTLRDSLASSLGQTTMARFVTKIEEARKLHQFWTQYIELAAFDRTSGDVSQAWDQAQSQIASVLEKKLQSPLEKLDVSDELRKSVVAYNEVAEKVQSLSRSLGEANEKIKLRKSQTAEGDTASVKTDLERLRLTKLRYTSDIDQKCKDYVSAKIQKEALERDKEQARESLDKYRKSIFPDYEKTINDLLSKFNADFRLCQIEPINPKGRPSTNYALKVNGIDVSITQNQSGQPCFKNILSAGDRNTLALAFFFSTLVLDPNLSNCVVVIDDPVSSLDEGRSIATATEIRDLIAKSHQVIVLSHSKSLLCTIWSHANPNECATLELRRSQNGSSFELWNINEAATTEYDRRHEMLRKYASGEKIALRDVAQSIRPLLEGFLRIACNEEFSPGTLLGNFIVNARNRLANSNPIMNKSDIDELDLLKDYSNRFHHDTNPSWDTEISNINDTQLLGFVQRTLAFTKRP